MTAEGSIREQPLPEVLLELGREGRTGILTIQGQQEIIAFAFLRGGIVSADALNQTMEDGLGVVLEDLDLVSAHQFSELAAEYQAGGGQVVDLLVERGLIERERLLEVVRTHTYRLCRQALGWEDGDYKFYQGEEVSYEEGVLPIPPEELLIHASRDSGRELLPGGFPANEDIFERADGGAMPVPVEGAEAGSDAEPAALAAFELFDGQRTVSEIAADSGVPEHRLVFLLNRWQPLGLVERAATRRGSKRTASEDGTVKKAKKAKRAKKTKRVKAAGSAPPRASRLVAWWRDLRERPPSESYPWPTRFLGLGLMALLAISFATAPSRILLPFPWQGGLAKNLDRERLGAELSRLRSANSAYFLLQGRFAENLPDLASGRLLPSIELRDEAGRPLAYSATEASYVVRSSADAGVEPETYLQETIRGNFLLDPELERPPESRRPPLVLLD